jgi:hypothetical protein
MESGFAAFNPKNAGSKNKFLSGADYTRNDENEQSIMSPVKNVIGGYRKVERHILLAVAAQFGIQAINTAFFLLLNYYMAEEGFADYEVSEVLSYRFLAVFWLAFPLGLFIKGRQLKPFFYIASIAVPLFSHLILLAIAYEWRELLNFSAMAWGVAYTCMQITILPYILLNARRDTHSEAFSLSFLSFSLTICVVGITNYFLHRIDPEVFTEKAVLQIVATLSLLSLFFVSRLRNKEQITDPIPLRKVMKDYDWPLIFKALIPTSIIAIGAGFTVPVINLFFLNVHGVPSNIFSIVGSATFLLVAAVMIFMPYIRRSFGYKVAITLFQGMSVFALLMLATTEYYREWPHAAGIALFFYVLRQPLMSAATPMTNELTMYYVGKCNQEIMSALNASIWSGSWFVSMKLFGWLRQLEFRYVSIFLITVAMYAAGVGWYAYLIRSYEQRTGNDGVERKKFRLTKKKEHSLKLKKESAEY